MQSDIEETTREFIIEALAKELKGQPTGGNHNHHRNTDKPNVCPKCANKNIQERTILRSLKRLSADGQSIPAGLRDLRHISEWHPAGWW